MRVLYDKSKEEDMAEKRQGKIIKGIGGFYYVDIETEQPIETRARGLFRKNGVVPLVGDFVEISIDAQGKGGFVEKILPRKNQLVRPPVANIDILAIVAATIQPRPNLYVLDKMIAAAAYVGIQPILCLNKIDLSGGEELEKIYSSAGYTVIKLSALQKENFESLRTLLKGKTTAFAGNSGVGKSSILNCLFDDTIFATGLVNEKIERGRHTTRHSELVPLPSGGYVIDTPGFSTFQLTEIAPQQVAELFAEFQPYLSSCRFTDCLHTCEKGCAVLSAVQQGKISASRHQNYVRLLEEVQSEKKW